MSDAALRCPYLFRRRRGGPRHAPSPIAQEGGAALRWQPGVEVASGEAHRGPWRMNESDFRYVDDPAVAINDAGAVGVVWADQAAQDIFFQLFEPDGTARLPEAVNVSASPEIFSWLPKMAISPDDPDRIYILWQEIVFSGGSHGGEIFFARSIDGGRSFSAPINLSDTPAGAGKGRLTRDFWHNGSHDLTLGANGEIYAVWSEYEGALRFSRSEDGGESFSEPLHLAGSFAEPARAPSLAAGAGGDLHLAWTVGEDRGGDVYLARSLDGGRTFGPHRKVAPGDGHAEGPKIAVDAAGTLHLVYAESPRGPLDRYHILYTRKAAGVDDVEAPRRIAGPQGRWQSANFPEVGLGAEGEIYVIWELFSQPVAFPEGLGFTVSVDGGQRFAPSGTIPGSADAALGTGGGRQGLLMQKLAANSRGEVAVVHSTFLEGERSHVWLFRAQRPR